jgi:drug/metabolite transporter (DMT)-like permease
MSDQSKAKTKAILLLVLAAALWSTSGVLIKLVQWSPLALASARGLLAALTMMVMIPGGYRPRLMTKNHWLSAWCLCILSILFIWGMKLAPAANVIVFQYTAPLWVAFLAPVLLGERTRGRDFLFMGLIFGGVVLFFVDDLSPEGFWGNVMGLGSGLFFGLQAMGLRRLKNNNPAQAVMTGHLLTFLVLLPFWGPPWPDLTGWLMVGALGVFQMGVSYGIYSMVVPRVSSLEMVLVPMLEPIICPVWVYIFVGERPGPWAAAGGAVVLVSVTVWSLTGLRAQKKSEPGAGTA